jgi:uncharacterized protein YjiK
VKNFCLLISLLFCARALGATTIAPLRILESFNVPAKEISGATWRVDPKTKKSELLLQSDRKHSLYFVDWDARASGVIKVREYDLKSIDQQLDPKHSGWESVSADDSGRVYLLQEDPARVLVISADLTKLEATIELLPPTDPAERKAWLNEPNSRGEGMLLLKNGHILFLKEKKPLRLIEYALPSEKPTGYKKSLNVEHSGTFALPQGEKISFAPIAEWRLDDDSDLMMEDASSLDTDDDGNLFLLGDKRNWIASIGAKLDPSQKTVSISKIWIFPAGIKKAEGFAIDKDGRPVVAIDSKVKDRGNLFLLSPLE